MSSINYVSDFNGVPIAVQIPIEEWSRIKNKYPEIDDLNNELPGWQRTLIDRRLAMIKEDPTSLRPIEGLLDELDKEEI